MQDVLNVDENENTDVEVDKYIDEVEKHLGTNKTQS